MARDYMTLGGAPVGEDCAQVGAEDYYPRMRKETRRYIAQLEKQFAHLLDRVFFKVKAFAHDFGTYHEVCVYYEEKDIDAAIEVENNIPEKWA